MGEFTIKNLEVFRQEKKKDNYIGDYIPENFWKELGSVYHQHFNTENMDFKSKGSIGIDAPSLIGRITEIDPKSILEVGCGFGRLLPFVKNSCPKVEEIVGMEFSETMIENSKQWLKATRCESLKIVQGMAQEIPFPDNSFDMVYTHVCLTHIPPKDIKQVTKEIFRVSKKWILHMERFAFPYEHPNPHRWSHMLVPYYWDLGCELLENDVIHETNCTNVYLFKK